jgi:hypothetical protein
LEHQYGSLSIKWTLGQCSYTDFFDRWNISDSVRESIVSVTLEFPGNWTRLRELFPRLAAGEPLVLATFGGSVTCGHHTSKTYGQFLFDWINCTFPHPKSRFLNLGIPACGADIPSYCLDQFLGSQLADINLAILEFAINPSSERDVSRLARRLLSLPKKPALLYLIIYSLRNGPLPNYLKWNPQSFPFSATCRQLGATTLNMRALVFYHSFAPFLESKLFAEDKHHFSTSGHQLAASILYHNILKLANESSSSLQ